MHKKLWMITFLQGVWKPLYSALFVVKTTHLVRDKGSQCRNSEFEVVWTHKLTVRGESARKRVNIAKMEVSESQCWSLEVAGSLPIHVCVFGLVLKISICVCENPEVK